MQQQETLPEIRKTVIVEAPIDKVWKAVSTSSGLAAWWMDNTFEPVVGHAFILRSGQFGDSPCTVTDIEPMTLVGFDWGKDWHLEFRLTTEGEDKTAFTLVHSGWDAAKATEFGQPHPVVRGIMDGGWEKIVNERFVQYIGSEQE